MKLPNVMPPTRELAIWRSPFHSSNPLLLQSIMGLGADQVLVTSVADGDRGTRQTLQIARRLVAQGLRDPQIHELALAFCKAYGGQSYDDLSELQALFQGVLEHFDYRKHVVGGQSLQPASGILRTRSGDCAELNLILLPALLGTIGYPSRAVAIKADASRPQEYSHVYIEAQTSDGEWVPLDVARQGTVFGVAPERYWQREEFDLTPAEGGSMRGYGTRGMGVLVRKPKAIFPRRGVGQDGDSGYMSTGEQEYVTTVQNTPAILGGVAQIVQASRQPNYSAYGTMAPGLSASVGGSSIWIVGGVLVVLGIALAFRGRR